MNKVDKPNKIHAILFFLGFVVLLCLVFTLGVMVGKGLNDSNTYVIQKGDKRDELSSKVPDSTEKESEYLVFNYEDNSKYDKLLNEKTKEEEQPKKVEKKTIRESNTKATSTTKTPKINKEIQPKKSETKSTKTQEKAKVASIDKKNKPATESADFPKTDPVGVYTVQLGSFRSLESATEFEKKLKDKGYPSFTKKIDLQNKGIWYRVRVGTFKSTDIAKIYADRLILKENFIKSAYVTRND